MSKRMISFAVSVLLLFSACSLSSSALEKVGICSANYNDEISPCWDNVNSSTLTLGFTDSGKIEGSVSIFGTIGTKYKNGTIKIDRYYGSKWNNVKTWSNLSSASKNFFFSTNTLTAISGAKYRLTVKITAYNGSSSEVINLSKTSTNS